MFNLNSYQHLLETFLNKEYKFVFFDQRNIFDKVILMRHDVDASLKIALQMAQIEKKLNIYSTYFIMLRSPMYNIFSRSNIQIVKKIMSFGHKIGLHFDAFNITNNKILQESIDFEINILNILFNIDINVVSFHQPSKQIIDNNFKIKQINTYDINDFFYISDSNANPRIFNTNSVLKYKKIQILIHPMWWVCDNYISTEECWNNVIINNFKEEEKQLLATERAYGAERCIKIIKKR